MDIRTIQLTQPYSFLDIYHSNTTTPLPGLVIIPGGSYHKVAERDSERVAITMAAHAFQTFVVRYPVVEHRSYQDAKKAIAEAFDYLVAHAAALDLDPQQLGIIGFSAGGQLAAAYSNHPDTKAQFVALGYPVITPQLDDHMGVTTENVAQLVTAHTPATFLWGSINDQLTPYLDHLAVYAQALAEHQVKFELHEFATGGHGMALANYYTSVVNRSRADSHLAQWLPLFLGWFSRWQAARA